MYIGHIGKSVLHFVKVLGSFKKVEEDQLSTGEGSLVLAKDYSS